MYKLAWGRTKAYIVVVGCGGTGGFVAEGLCRLLPKSYDIGLVDHDRVEESNLGRQNFLKSELGQFKSEALALRLSENYGRPVEFSTSPVELLNLNNRGHLTIGCVDNASARSRLQFAGAYTLGGLYSYAYFNGWYIDAGNGEHSGQVLIGNSLEKGLQHSFIGEACYKLPLPTIQQPALLAPQVKRRNCAEAVQANEQSPVINQAMAALVLQFVDRLIHGELTWMGAYIDLENMSLSAVPAEPGTVARLMGVKENGLIMGGLKAKR